MIAAFMVPQKRDFISRDDAKIAAWTILEGMGVSAKHNERLVEEVDTVVDDIPAADVRPVKRGFWVEENGEDAHTGELWCIWKCSECGARRTAGWRHTQEGRKPRDNFCSNCGAEMEVTE